ncbi:MAG: TonB-dependent receptor, partial [Candidatus Binatia bacterium]
MTTARMAVSGLAFSLAAGGIVRAEEPPPAPTDAAPRGRVIEEIIVTAEKREAALHDVPISMSALGSDFIAEQGITDLRDVSLYVPNVQVDVNGFFVYPRIRGFSTEPLNRAFEQAVGLVVDGVPYARSDYFQTALFDLERIEVLRGPQGTLFGKNTTVGTFNMATKDPTDEYTGFADAQLGELGRRRFEAGLGGPVVSKLLNFRVAALSDELDGYVDNTTASVVPGVTRHLGGRDRKGGRLKLQLPDVAGGSLVVGYERVEMDVEGAPLEIRRLPEGMEPFFLQFDPATDFAPDNFRGSKNTPERSDLQVDTIVARASYPLGDWSLDGVVGYSRLQVKNAIDIDNTPANLLFAAINEDSPQTTVELRVSSPSLAGFFGLLGSRLGSTDFTAGFFFQRQELDPVQSFFMINPEELGQLLACDAIVTGGGTCPAAGPPPSSLETSFLTLTQTTDSYAGFGQMNWHFTDRWRLLYGMRLNYEKKTVHYDERIEPNSAVLIPTQLEEFQETNRRNEFHFAPKVGMAYDLTDDLSAFLTWARSFRGGGFDTNNPNRNVEDRSVEPESVTSWELGSKMSLLGGAAELNLGLYWMELEDFQVITFKPESVVQNPLIENAAEVRAHGVEADLAWLPTSWLTLRGALGFNDTKFTDFKKSTCEKGRENFDGDGDARCDVTGEPLDRAPKWNASGTGRVEWPLAFLQSAAVKG